MAPSGAPSIPDTGTNGTTGSPTDQGTGTTGTTDQAGGPPQGGGRGGFGVASGATVAAITDTGLTLTTADGQPVEVATTADTTYHRQVAATRDDIVVGSSVRVQVEGGFGGPGAFGRGQGGPGQDPTGALPSGAPVAGTSMTATEVELLASDTGSAATGQGGRGIRGGLSGTVSAVDEGSITLTTAAGETTVTTTDSTTYAQQADATRDDVTIGSSVRLTTAGRPGGGDTSAMTVSDVEVLLPAE